MVVSQFSTFTLTVILSALLVLLSHNHTYYTIKILLMIDPAKQEIISRHLAMASVEGGAMVGQIEWLKGDVTRLKVELELLE